MSSGMGVPTENADGPRGSQVEVTISRSGIGGKDGVRAGALDVTGLRGVADRATRHDLLHFFDENSSPHYVEGLVPD